ncbi:two-component system C4-dicarboxylate transport sensor histidine kinase DctB [Rubricella aquisinus]|uniref:histidine kinase n=1 Tax=Rubricella aquisinus TaxID=2028108 RepID=A0A840WNN0_9RHOB|nr:ATP-binding protein [Rubricella aquisinus]MBB5516221.1 two-component system C4-dicarboxylate transport sensor histidine kinase DctB [Rubricella aquisinus]
MPRSRILFVLMALLVICGVIYASLMGVLLRQGQAETEDRADIQSSMISAAIGRLDHLPHVIAQDPVIMATLRTGAGDALNPRLLEYAQRAEAEAIYLMDPTGLTIASSNYNEPGTYVGEYYTFRPYFTDALAGKTGRYFAVGATTGRPGYFVAEPVIAAGRVIGVVVVKIGLAELSTALTGAGALILVTSPEGVVVLSSQEDLAFRTIAPLDPAARAIIDAQRQYGSYPLTPLDWESTGTGRLMLEGKSYLWAIRAIPREGWTVHLLTDVAGLRRQASVGVILALAVLLTAGIGMTVFRSAQLRRALELSDADRRRLTEEIRERQRAEADLRAAEAELGRSSRLAALGQLAASITHELGQPISAMRNYLAAEEIAQGTLPGALNQTMTGLIARMQGIVDQLRFFATPGAGPRAPFAMADAVAAAITLVEHTALSRDVTLEVLDKDQAALALGVQHRVEQVLVNLIRNALDAVEDQPVRRVTIRFAQTEEEAQVRVSDTGPGLGKHSLSDLQEPFMTTKSSGAGMGLGLAISASIVADLSGRLEAQDGPEGGAVFTLSLPKGVGNDVNKRPLDTNF